MNQELPTKNYNKLCIDNKMLWLLIGTAIFAFIAAFVLPVTESLKKVVQEYGFADNMIKTGVASSISQAAWKAKLVLGIIPMATIFFCTEAIPIGLVGILKPFLAYFFYLLPDVLLEIIEEDQDQTC